jgi:hypothetical protein
MRAARSGPKHADTPCFKLSARHGGPVSKAEWHFLMEITF